MRKRNEKSTEKSGCRRAHRDNGALLGMRGRERGRADEPSAAVGGVHRASDGHRRRSEKRRGIRRAHLRRVQAVGAALRYQRRRRERGAGVFPLSGREAAEDIYFQPERGELRGRRDRRRRRNEHRRHQLRGHGRRRLERDRRGLAHGRGSGHARSIQPEGL